MDTTSTFYRSAFAAGATHQVGTARNCEGDLVGVVQWLRLATTAARFPTVSNGVLLFPTVATGGYLGKGQHRAT